MNNENNKLQTYEKLISAQGFEEQQTPEQARNRVAEIQGSENAALEQEVAQLKQKYETSKNEKKAMRQARVQAIQNQKELLICGSDADKMSNLISEHFSDKIKCYTQDFDIITTNSLFNLAEKKIASNEDTLKDFEGPTYLRASEAEENLKA